MADTQPCPDCAEEIAATATKCPECGSSLVVSPVVVEQKGFLTRRVSCLGAAFTFGGGLWAVAFGTMVMGRGFANDFIFPFLISVAVTLLGIFLVNKDLTRGEERSGMCAAPLWQSCLIFVIILGTLIAIPNILESHHSRRYSNGSRAIGALKTIGTAQSLFREADKEGDGNLDYGTLKELANSGTTGLIDSVLGSGTKSGYLFTCTYGASTSEFIWFATATPITPGTTGDRYFATNHEGVTFYTTQCAFSVDSITCTIPPGVQPVGK